MLLKTTLRLWTQSWERMIAPAATIEIEDQRRQARLLSALLLSLLVSSLIITPIWVSTTPDFWLAPYISLTLILLLAVAYGLSRTRAYCVAAMMLILLILWVVGVVLFLAPGPMIARMLVLNFLIVDILISSLFLRQHVTWLLAGISLVAIGSFFFVPDVPFAFAYSYLVFFLIIIALGALSTSLERDYKYKLVKNEERYRSVVAAMSEGILLQSSDTIILACNVAAELILGVSANQIIGRTYLDLDWRAIHEDGSLFPMETHPALVTLRTGQPFSGVIMGIYKAAGDLRWISINSQPLRGRGDVLPYAVVTSFTDITERQQHERALLEAQHRYRGLFDQSHDAVFLLDLNGRHLEANRRAADMLGYTLSEIQHLSTDYLSDDVVESGKMRQQLIDGEYLPVYERFFRQKDGTRIAVEIKAELVRDLDGNPLHIQSVVREITERKSNEQQLRLQSAALEAAANAILITNRQGIIEWSNPAYMLLTGYSTEEARGKNFSELVKSGHHETAFYKTMWDTILSGQTWHGTMVNRHKNGRLYTEEQTITPVRDMNGAITHFVAIQQDVTEREETESALRESEERYRYMFDNNQAVKLLIDPQTGRIVDANLGAVAFYGYSREQLVSMRIQDINMLTEAEVFTEMELARSEKRNFFAFRHRLANGVICNVEVFSGPVITQGKQYLYSIIMDVTARQQAEEALRRSELRQRAMLSAIPDLMFRNHRDGTYLDYHATDPSRLFVSPEQFLGRKIMQIIPGAMGQLHMHYLEQVLQTGEPARYEYELPIENQIMYFEARMAVAGPDEVLTIVRDITEQKRMQAQTLALSMERERIKLLNQFVQNASHEFRTPLSIINTDLYLMTKAADEEKRLRYAKRSEQQVARLTRLLDMILSMTKLDSDAPFNFRLVDVNELGQQALSGMSQDMTNKQQRWQFTPGVSLPALRADKDWLLQAVGHLLENAIQFTPEGGKIALSTSCVAGQLIIAIQDTGIGIGKPAQAHLFERFWRLDEAHSTPGFGLGLPIAQRIVQRHGGTIVVESAEGKGSTFMICLPI